jgi:phage shock protein A
MSRNERKIQQAMGRFDRLQSQVERLEARVRSYEVGAPATSAWEAELKVSDPAIEAELEALKEKTFGKTPKAKPEAASPTPETTESEEA